MTKAYPQFYQGQAYIQLSQLPENQASMLKSWLSMFNQKINHKENEERINYDVYDMWYETNRMESSALYEF
ncbi:MAG: hypothetical protein ACFCUU_18405 [Cyclobacteriaceae bacterium]